MTMVLVGNITKIPLTMKRILRSIAVSVLLKTFSRKDIGTYLSLEDELILKNLHFGLKKYRKTELIKMVEILEITLLQHKRMYKDLLKTKWLSGKR
jgi:hypothetical protein